MLLQWETYWSEEYTDIKREVGRTEHLDELKAASWRAMQVFMECYNDTANIIDLAVEIDDFRLYPLAVLSMLKIYDDETCFDEYCEYEFEQSEDWESIAIEDNKNDNEDITEVFFIRKYDF